MGRQPSAAERLPANRASREERTEEASVAALQIELAEVRKQLQKALGNRRSAEKKLRASTEQPAPVSTPVPKVSTKKVRKINSSTTFHNYVDELCRILRKFDRADVVPLLVSALRKLGKEVKEDLLWKLVASKGFKSVRERLNAIRDADIAKHLRENVYTAPHWALLRLVGNMSKRFCHLVEQSVKYEHRTDGTKVRQKMMSDSAVPAPELFQVSAIEAQEAQAVIDSCLTLRDHADRRGADICGKPYALDRAMLDSVEQMSRAGGMATAGTAEDPHLMCMTGDGAGVSAADSGVRVAHFPGSTAFLNQSSQDVRNWLFYRASAKAEDYTVLNARLAHVLPQLRRIFQKGCLCMEDGTPTNVHVKLVLVADKPFIRHVWCAKFSFLETGTQHFTFSDFRDFSTLATRI